MMIRALAAVLTCVLVASCSGGDDAAEDESRRMLWFACEVDDECEVARGDATCGAEGFCVDPSGVRIETPRDGGSGSGDSGQSGSGATGGSHESGAGGASASGGSSGDGDGDGDAGGYDPCARKACGESCSLCAPGDLDCVETDEVKRCDAAGTCTGSPVECASVDGGAGLPECDGPSQGDDCDVPGTEPSECCDGNTHLRCDIQACTNSIPGSCFGTLEPVEGSSACGGYDACAGKQCGDACEICDPADPSCVQSDAVQTCDARGVCVIGGVECVEPVTCILTTGSDPVSTCGPGEVCCAMGRCGPVVFDTGICEPVDPKTGACVPCACEMEPFGCPR